MRTGSHEFSKALKSFFVELKTALPEIECISVGYSDVFGEWSYFLHTKEGGCYNFTDDNDTAATVLAFARELGRKNNILFRKFEL